MEWEDHMLNGDSTTLEVQIPADWSDLLDNPTRLLEILSLGLEEYRLRQAMTLYRSGSFSLAYAAEQAGLPVRVLLEKGRQRGLLPQSDEGQFAQDLLA
jgi:predicted HTH domain antitoxin